MIRFKTSYSYREFSILFFIICTFYSATGQNANAIVHDPLEQPRTIGDSNWKIQEFTKGLQLPTTMAFLGSDDVLVLEKNTAAIKRIKAGEIVQEYRIGIKPVHNGERGMLGIAVSNETKNGILQTYVFIYSTQHIEEGLLNESCNEKHLYCVQDGEPFANRLYRYELVEDKLVNPKMLLDLPATPGPNHNGGSLLVSDKSIFTVIGDLTQSKRSYTQNAKNGTYPDGTGGILRITFDGEIPPDAENLSFNKTFSKYYAYGIRNSFGMDVDPLTGKLWDTENGPEYGDEINLVEQGFNSGWSIVQGIWEPNRYSIGNVQMKPDNFLVSLDDKAAYSEPEFIWKKSVGVTAIKFLASDRYGEKYENDMFVGDFQNGRLYHFDLEQDRSALSQSNRLHDKVVETNKEIDNLDIVFAEGFGGITDIEISPDGYMYILSHTAGKIFKIIPR